MPAGSLRRRGARLRIGAPVLVLLPLLVGCSGEDTSPPPVAQRARAVDPLIDRCGFEPRPAHGPLSDRQHFLSPETRYLRT